MSPEKQDAAPVTDSAGKASSSWATRWEKTKLFIVKNYLPIAFLVALALALAWPVPGRFLANVSILGNVRICQVAPMVLVFLITGLQLNTSELKRALALRNLPVVMYGFVAILIATPCLGFALREAPLDPWEFATGLAIFTVAPTTLGVGVALTEACGGNRAMALLLTVGTNALAVFTMPPELRLLLPPGHGRSGGGGSRAVESAATLNMDVKINDLLVKLAVTVLVPFAIGKVVRELLPAAERFVKTHRVSLSLLSTTSLAFVVWQTLSAARDQLLAQRAGPVFAMIGLAIAMHLAYLVANYLIVWFVLRAPLREAIAVVIMASQKSAPVAVTTITFMTTDAAQQGLLSLPSIVGQLCQIFIGAALAKWLSSVVQRSEQRDKAEADAKAAEAEAAAAAAQEAALAGDGGAEAATARELELTTSARAGAGADALRSTERDMEWNADRAAAEAAPETAGSGELRSVTFRGGGDGGGSGSVPGERPSSRKEESASRPGPVAEAAAQTHGSAAWEGGPSSGRLAAGSTGGRGTPGVAPLETLPQRQPHLHRIPGQLFPPVL